MEEKDVRSEVKPILYTTNVIKLSDGRILIEVVRVKK
jgi:hypothetical protein